ncbi:MAG: phosphatase domain-containing protein, partial [Rubrobacteraceae bacterium]
PKSSLGRRDYNPPASGLVVREMNFRGRVCEKRGEKGLMGGWRERLLTVIESAERRVGRAKLYLKMRYGWLGPVSITPYVGHGTPQEFHLLGRVLEEREIPLGSAGDSALRNLRTMIRRFLSAEVPGARVRVRFEGRERVVVADDEGFVDVSIRPSRPLPEDRAWHTAELELLWPTAKGQDGFRTEGSVLVPPSKLRDGAFGVVSDIDDTIVRTEATSLLRMARLVLFSNAHTRLPFEGVAAFYRALQRGAAGDGDNPIFYVSTGPWNLYDLLENFLEIQELPRGPIFLKDWGGLKDLLKGMNHRQHKLEVIREIFDTHPTLSFVLIGDSGQQDAETYGQLAREYPGRVLAIYIRDVSRKERDVAVRAISEEMRSLEVPMLLVNDTVEAAEHAAARELVSPRALEDVREEREEDSGGRETLSEVLEALQPPSGTSGQ